MASSVNTYSFPAPVLGQDRKAADFGSSCARTTQTIPATFHMSFDFACYCSHRRLSQELAVQRRLYCRRSRSHWSLFQNLRLFWLCRTVAFAPPLLPLLQAQRTLMVGESRSCMTLKDECILLTIFSLASNNRRLSFTYQTPIFCNQDCLHEIVLKASQFAGQDSNPCTGSIFCHWRSLW